MATTDGTITVRPATMADVEAVTAITAAAYRKYIPRMGRQPRPMTDDYSQIFASQPVWVADLGQRPIAVLVLMPEPAAMLIYSVAVHPDYQKRGLGRRLLTLAEEQALAAGYQQIRLYTNEHMVENIALYLQLGYQETGREPVSGTNIVHMVKALGGEAP